MLSAHDAPQTRRLSLAKLYPMFGSASVSSLMGDVQVRAMLSKLHNYWACHPRCIMIDAPTHLQRMSRIVHVQATCYWEVIVTSKTIATG